MDAQIQIIKRDTIPPIREVEQGGEVHSLGELRDFSWSEPLREFMPRDAAFSISWVKLRDGEVLAPHTHPIQSMMVVYGGRGEMLGDLRRPIQAGHVIVVPPGRLHGFVAGKEGLSALSIQFGKGLYSAPKEPRVAFAESEEHSLTSLLTYNERRLAEFQRKAIFELLADGTLDNPVARQAFNDYLQIWVDGNQRLLFSRQATCRDPSFERVFLLHMQDELGHDVMHKDRKDAPVARRREVRDSILEAITSWFVHQMYVADNAEKAAIIHLVIENASAVYHKKAEPVLARYVNQEYFDVHVENDDGHAALGLELLKDESPRGYARLRKIVGEAWDMVEAMTDRVVHHTERAARGEK